MNRFLFSFIIPHYCIPNLLLRCIDSIPKRDDTQIIIIDDQSPDYDSYPDRFPDLFQPGIQWIRAPRNGGAGYARNLGLKQAEGKWILFADADDFFTEGLAGFLDEYKDAREDILFFRNKCCLSDQPDQPSTRSDWMQRMFDYYQETGDINFLRFNHWVPWGKMFRGSFLKENGIQFDEIPYSNDVVFSVLSGSKAQLVQVVDQVLYVVTEREGSLTSMNRRKPGEMAVRADAALRAQKIAQDCGYHNVLFPLTHYLYKMYYHDRPLFREFFRRIPEVYPSYWIPMKTMARYERGLLRKGLLYTYSLFTYLTTRHS